MKMLLLIYAVLTLYSLQASVREDLVEIRGKIVGIANEYATIATDTGEKTYAPLRYIPENKRNGNSKISVIVPLIEMKILILKINAIKNKKR